jgi:hypothetical protein
VDISGQIAQSYLSTHDAPDEYSETENEIDVRAIDDSQFQE